MAGVFATILTHPIDVVRAQLTVQTSTTKGDLIVIIVSITISHRVTTRFEEPLSKRETPWPLSRSWTDIAINSTIYGYTTVYL